MSLLEADPGIKIAEQARELGFFVKHNVLVDGTAEMTFAGNPYIQSQVICAPEQPTFDLVRLDADMFIVMPDANKEDFTFAWFDFRQHLHLPHAKLSAQIGSCTLSQKIDIEANRSHYSTKHTPLFAETYVTMAPSIDLVGNVALRPVIAAFHVNGKTANRSAFNRSRKQYVSLSERLSAFFA